MRCVFNIFVSCSAIYLENKETQTDRGEVYLGKAYLPK